MSQYLNVYIIFHIQLNTRIQSNQQIIEELDLRKNIILLTQIYVIKKFDADDVQNYSSIFDQQILSLFKQQVADLNWNPPGSYHLRIQRSNGAVAAPILKAHQIFSIKFPTVLQLEKYIIQSSFRIQFTLYHYIQYIHVGQNIPLQNHSSKSEFQFVFKKNIDDMALSFMFTILTSSKYSKSVLSYINQELLVSEKIFEQNNDPYFKELQIMSLIYQNLLSLEQFIIQVEMIRLQDSLQVLSDIFWVLRIKPTPNSSLVHTNLALIRFRRKEL
ncbi:Hypothetical_protein [Hexamita inflata]|uniref:Hypothetical_protein n=1 Tax=Hexamita inflata TaxID=28002 RepID=A0AA86QDZ7_9EUKA|nr:Hypothetical protein HINF_LOCUS45184 [Hexamita inflata]